MRSTVYPGYLRNRHKFIAIALLVEFPGNRIGKHRFFSPPPPSGRQGKCSIPNKVDGGIYNLDENSWFFVMKNKFKSASNSPRTRTISRIILFKFSYIYLYLLYLLLYIYILYLFIYTYFDLTHTIRGIQFFIFRVGRRKGHFVLVTTGLTIDRVVVGYHRFRSIFVVIKCSMRFLKHCA